ncbi:MAG: ribbon-helix-helix domain-containing protein [Pseudomonadota bacterium]
MCQIFAGQDPARFESVSRSIRLSGHATSIRLEAAFWAIIDEIAANQGLSTPKFLSMLYSEVEELRGEVPNFTSMLRTTCLLHLSGAQASASELAEISASAA